MPKFRKKPVVIEAVKFRTVERGSGGPTNFDGQLFDETPEWLLNAQNVRPYLIHESDYVYLRIETLEGDHIVSPGDWIIRDVKGELYPCKPDIFEATYEPVKE